MVQCRCSWRCQLHKNGQQGEYQDGAVIHCTYEKTKVVLGNNVSVGHNTLIHGCTVEDNVLLGMGAIVMDNCYIESNCIIAAGTFFWRIQELNPGLFMQAYQLKKVKTLSKEMFDGEVKRIADNYVMYSGWFKDEN